MILETTYHSVAREGDISISSGIPKFPHKAVKRYEPLMPHSVLRMKNFYHLQDGEYIERFIEGLKFLNPSKVWSDLQRLAGEGNAPCIVCFEKWDKMCHRHIVAQWLSQELGVRVVERYKNDSLFGKRLRFDEKRFLYLECEE